MSTTWATAFPARKQTKQALAKRTSEGVAQKAQGPESSATALSSGPLVSSLLYDRGLVAMSITTERGKTDSAGNGPLTFVIDEGDVYTLSSIHASGLGAPIEKELLEKVIKVAPSRPSSVPRSSRSWPASRSCSRSAVSA